MAKIQVIAKRIGKDHELALALWATGWYEARLLAALVGEPSRITTSEMDRWCRDFDNWAVCEREGTQSPPGDQGPPARD